MRFPRTLAILTVAAVTAACSSAPGPNTAGSSSATPSSATSTPTSTPTSTGAAPSPAPATPSMLTPVLAQAVAEPIPVPATDGKTHLVYELTLTNTLSQDVTLTSLEVRAGDTLLLTLPADRLTAVTRLLGSSAPTGVLGPAQTAHVWLDVTLPAGTPAPERLIHALGLSVRRPQPPLVPAALVEEVAPVTVQKRAPISIAPPLSGPNWLDGDGCCGISGHRGALNPINGSTWVAERFAIDYLQLMPDGKLFTGAPSDLSGYPYYGTDVHAVADGPVVAVVDGMAEETPFAAPKGLTLDQYPGNHVVQDLGGGNYALYAHLQTGSITVKPGDRLTTGQSLAHLGNTGNTDAPHLHFHVMSTPDPLRSDGLPFVFSSFDLQGRVPNSQDPLTAGRPVPMPPASAATPQRDVMPLQDDLMTYATR
ncbi:M23 family metallopeptidase [Mycolicibacterium sp. 018/SC-01/001]|uniref:M23 family metallopeptidase n=1 Tax=Mycolicibacterium sp. 018/SC-01/001 TaxID=2592069 RepID=UPI001180AE79|nr:M23 family metallopeptidase [Mycolicibacterium sp. 018/SC-01/001]TRW87868.1 M23 family metallopeptidase [Mycolicibacterium sp. 018/SC-01/001]